MSSALDPARLVLRMRLNVPVRVDDDHPAGNATAAQAVCLIGLVFLIRPAVAEKAAHVAAE